MTIESIPKFTTLAAKLWSAITAEARKRAALEAAAVKQAEAEAKKKAMAPPDPVWPFPEEST